MNITSILNAITALAAAVVSVFLIPYIKSKTTRQQREQLAEWIYIAVEAAEQLFGSGMGATKKEYVVGFLQDKGLIADIEQIDSAINALIESAVYELKG